MSRDEEYFKSASSWAADATAQGGRSRRAAWIVAGIATAVALFEAVAIAMMSPLKTVQPITLLVDRQTGYVQALDPLRPRRVAADQALTSAFLAQYVEAREGFDRATIGVEYRKAALWSAARARAAYLSEIPASNPASAFNRYPPGAVVRVRTKSVSRLGPGAALVRFDTQLLDRTGRPDPPKSWISLVRFHYTDAPMRIEDRLVNPLGFQVTDYQRDAESQPPTSAEIAPGSDTP